MSDDLANLAAKRREEAAEHRALALNRRQESFKAMMEDDGSTEDGPILDDNSFETPYQKNLWASLINLCSRINDHIARMDAGVFYAVDDLAVSLRVLLREGDGSGLLLAAIKEFELAMPPVYCSAAAYNHAEFGIGAIPILEGLPGLKDEVWAEVTLEDWLNANVLSMRLEPGAEQTYVSWNKLIGDYANKFGGAHLQRRTAPAYMARMDWYGVAELALSGYLLRSAGVLSYLYTQDAINEIASKVSGGEKADDLFWGGVGARKEPPDEGHALGMLFRYHHDEHQVVFRWFVDEDNPVSRLRLFFNHRVWDYSYTKEEGLTATNHDDPLSQFLFQAPRNPEYPYLGPDGLILGGSPYVHQPIVRTWRELKEDIPHEWPEDFHPNLPAPNWKSTFPFKKGEYYGTSPDLDEDAQEPDLGDA